MKVLILSLLTAMCLLSPAWAGGSGMGNGGDAVVCRSGNGTILSAELLDVYEARELRGIPFNLTGTTAQDAYKELLLRLAVRSPNRAKRYKDFIELFNRESRMVDGDLVDIPDSDHLSFPHGCKVEQLVIQQEPQTPYDARFLIQAQIWKALPAAQRGALMLHEALLHESMENFKVLGWETIQTRGLRYVNSLLFGFPNQLAAVSEKKFIDALNLIPNFYLGETANFGETPFRLRFGDLYLYTIREYDSQEAAITQAIVPPPIKGVSEYVNSGIPFELKFVEEGYVDGYHLRKESADVLSVSASSYAIDGDSVKEDLRNPDVKKKPTTPNTIAFGPGLPSSSLAINLNSKEIVRVFSVDDDYYNPTTFDNTGDLIGPFAFRYLRSYPRSGAPFPLYAIEWDSQFRKIRYRIDPPAERYGSFVLYIPGANQFLDLRDDGISHELEFDENNLPKGSSRVVFWQAGSQLCDECVTIWESGTWTPSAPRDGQFLPDPAACGRTPKCIPFKPAALPAKPEDLKLEVASDLKVTIYRWFGRKLRNKCLDLKAGMPWPESLPKGWIPDVIGCNKNIEDPVNGPEEK